MTADPDVLDRLDLMLAVLQLAHQTDIEKASVALRADDITDAILDACANEWVAAGRLTTVVVAKTKKSERSVRDRLQSLTTKRAIKRRGGGPSVEYRSMGLV
jgi:hypothetical protein